MNAVVHVGQVERSSDQLHGQLNVRPRRAGGWPICSQCCCCLLLLLLLLLLLFNKQIKINGEKVSVPTKERWQWSSLFQTQFNHSSKHLPTAKVYTAGALRSSTWTDESIGHGLALLAILLSWGSLSRTWSGCKK